MKDKIFIGKDFNSDYSFVNGTKTITLENMPYDLTDINQVLYLYNATSGITYYAPSDTYAQRITVSGTNEIILYSGYSNLTTGDVLFITIGIKTIGFDEDLNSLLTIPQARVPKEKSQFLDIITNQDICVSDGVEIAQFELDVREYEQITFLCDFIKNDSIGGRIIIYGLDEYGAVSPTTYDDYYNIITSGVTTNNTFDLPSGTSNFYLTFNTEGLNYLGFYTVADDAIGGGGSNEDTISVSVAQKPL